MHNSEQNIFTEEKDEQMSQHDLTNDLTDSKMNEWTYKWMNEWIITYLNNNVSHVISFLRMKKMFELNFVQTSVTVLISNCPTSLVTWLHSSGSKQERLKIGCLLCISTSFWVLHAHKSWSKHFFVSQFFQCFFLISGEKSLKNVWNEQKKLENGPKKCFDQLSGAGSKSWSKYKTVVI